MVNDPSDDKENDTADVPPVVSANASLESDKRTSPSADEPPAVVEVRGKEHKRSQDDAPPSVLEVNGNAAKNQETEEEREAREARERKAREAKEAKGEKDKSGSSNKGDILGTTLKVAVLFAIAPDLLAIGVGVCAAGQHFVSHRKHKPLKDLPEGYDPDAIGDNSPVPELFSTADASKDRAMSDDVPALMTAGQTPDTSKEPPELLTAAGMTEMNPEDLRIFGEALQKTARENMPENLTPEQRAAAANITPEEKKQALEQVLSGMPGYEKLSESERADILQEMSGAGVSADLETRVAAIAEKCGVPAAAANEVARQAVKEADPAVIIKAEAQKETQVQEEQKIQAEEDKEKGRSEDGAERDKPLSEMAGDAVAGVAGSVSSVIDDVSGASKPDAAAAEEQGAQQKKSQQQDPQGKTSPFGDILKGRLPVKGASAAGKDTVPNAPPPPPSPAFNPSSRGGNGRA